MAQARRERQLSLRHIKRGLGVTERAIMQPRHVFIGRIAHRGVVTVDV